MLLPQYVEFRTKEAPVVKVGTGGYLDHLPEQCHFVVGDRVQCSFVDFDEFVLTELRGDVAQQGFRLDLLTEHVGFWQIYQCLNQSEVYLPHSLPLTANRCFSFTSQNPKIPVQLSPGRQWVFMIGYKEECLPSLIQEFVMLGTFDTKTRLDQPVLWEPDISINHSLRDILQHIQQLKFRPFRWKAELFMAICLLVEEYCQQLDHQADQNERSRLSLYHKALNYIRENLLDSINRDMVAKGLGVSVRSLNRAFEGRPIKIGDYIQRLKLNQARDLLYAGDMSIEEVANLLNYPNRKYFSREFKKYFFQNPSSFRDEMREFKTIEEKEEE